MLLTALRLMFSLSLLTGVIYPYTVTAIGQGLFSKMANGSLESGSDGKWVGSALLAQKFEKSVYFWPRPSAADYATVASGASNLGPTSAVLKKQIEDRRQFWSSRHQGTVPDELLLSSGSGLDPHLSPAAARYQAQRVAEARKVPLEAVSALIEKQIEAPQWGLLGQARVNVLLLNLALDQTFRN